MKQTNMFQIQIVSEKSKKMKKPQMLFIPKNLFDLTAEEEIASKIVYKGRIIKCLITPYHNYHDLIDAIIKTECLLLLPERDRSIPQLKNLVNEIVDDTPKESEILIVTVSQNIIMDMIDPCVRILTEDGKIINSPEKTLMANIHDIRLSLLENKDHQITKQVKPYSQTFIVGIIDATNKKRKNPVQKGELDDLIWKANQIGEGFIRHRLLEQIARINEPFVGE